MWVGFAVGAIACDGSSHSIFSSLPQPDLGSSDGASATPMVRGSGGARAGGDGGSADFAQALDGGLPVLEESLDPSVRFEWKQTLPGQGTCKQGVYAGSFNCAIEFLFPPVTLVGTIVFTLTGSAEQQRLEIAEGAVSDSPQTTFIPGWTGKFSAGMIGELDCLSQRFTAETTAGTAVVYTAVPAVDGTTPEISRTFETTLNGNFDDQALTIDGDWSMTNNVGESCVGDFRVNATP